VGGADECPDRQGVARRTVARCRIRLPPAMTSTSRPWDEPTGGVGLYSQTSDLIPAATETTAAKSDGYEGPINVGRGDKERVGVSLVASQNRRPSPRCVKTG
jgi:hypothetical protein